MSEQIGPPTTVSSPVLEYNTHSSPSQSVNGISQQECDITSNNTSETTGGDYCFPTASNQDVENSPNNRMNHVMFTDKEVEKIEVPVPLESISGLLEVHRESSPTDVTFQCRYRQCDFKTTNSSKFIEHENTHAQERSFQCDVCHMKFTLFANMRRHKMSHLGVRPFECCLCPKRFFRKDHLMEHVVRQHSKQRPYCCPFCVKSFNYRPHLKAHLSSDHSGVPLDKTCKICGFQASSITGAKVHYTTCHVKRSSHVKQSISSHGTTNGVTTSESYGREEVTTAVDLGAVSQNFSFVPPTYSTISLPLNNDVIIEGPTSAFGKSCISQAVSTTSTFSGVSNGGSCIRKCVSPITVSPVGSISSPTTTVSPSSSRLNQGNQRSLNIDVKPEPVEVITDGSPERSNSQSRNQLDVSNNQDEVSLTPTDAQRQNTHLINPSGNSIRSSTLFHPPRSSSYQDLPANWIQPEHQQSSTESQFALSQGITLSSLPVPSTGHSNLSVWNSAPLSRETKLTRTSRSGLKNVPLSSHSGIIGAHRRPNNHHNGDVKVLKDRRFLDANRVSGVRAVEHTRRQESQLLEHNHSSPVSVNYHHSIELAHHSKLHTESSMAESEQGMEMSDRHNLVCPFCGIIFPDRTLYFLHRSLHTDSTPWKCNLCGQQCRDRYDFNSHIISQAHH